MAGGIPMHQVLSIAHFLKENVPLEAKDTLETRLDVDFVQSMILEWFARCGDCSEGDDGPEDLCRQDDIWVIT